MRKTPDETTCDWVRDRLPLLTVDDDLTAGERDGERRAVARHLAGCEPCRARRDGLSRAMEALSTAAAESPVDPDAPSLWPALQARIAAEGRRPRHPDDRPRAREASPRIRIVATRDRLLGTSAGPLAAVAAAALLALVVGLATTARVHEESAARIHTASAPLPAASRAPAPTPMPAPVASRSRPTAETGTAAVEPTDLALLDDPHPLDPEGRAITAPWPAPPETPPAVRFDLDRGVPMPPDSRVAQSAY